MILFLSDLHLGRGTPTEATTSERDVLALLRAHEGTVRAAGSDGGLVLVGDVFDQYIEYRHLVPKGFVRFQGLLAAWSDAGVPVTYLRGNRDPWHLDYFEHELGVPVRDTFETDAFGHRVYAAHGDGLARSERLYNAVKPVLRHPLAYRLYRTLTPGDSGYGLARTIARRGDGTPESATVAAVRDAARDTLRRTSADLVVLGHSHRAECTAFPEGTYLNPGYWHAERTFARLDADGPQLLRWANSASEPIIGNKPTGADVF